MGRDPWVTAEGCRELVQVLMPEPGRGGWRLRLLGWSAAADTAQLAEQGWS
jgi:hypothetical protein